jgi:hypothetical protein
LMVYGMPAIPIRRRCQYLSKLFAWISLKNYLTLRTWSVTTTIRMIVGWQRLVAKAEREISTVRHHIHWFTLIIMRKSLILSPPTYCSNTFFILQWRCCAPMTMMHKD